MSKFQGWLPPICLKSRSVRPQQQVTSSPSVDNTPLIIGIVDQIKRRMMSMMTPEDPASASSSIEDMSDMDEKMKRLRDYTRLKRLTAAIKDPAVLSSSNKEEDIAAIKRLYKEIDCIVWTYQYYTEFYCRSTSPYGAILSYPQFVHHLFTSAILPTIHRINDSNGSRQFVSSNNDDDDDTEPTTTTTPEDPSTQTIIDLLLCGTDIPIPASIFDLPNAFYAALESTKYPPILSSTPNMDESSLSFTKLSLVYMKRTQQLHVPHTSFFSENEKRYHVLYLYILAHVAFEIATLATTPTTTTTAIVDTTTVANYPTTTTGTTTAFEYPAWKKVLSDVVNCHPNVTFELLYPLVPMMSAIVQFDWCCCGTVTYEQQPENDDDDDEWVAPPPFTNHPYRNVEVVAKELLVDRYFYTLSDITHFPTYIIQSVYCDRLLRYWPCYDEPPDKNNGATTPILFKNDTIAIYSACHTLMSYKYLEQPNYHRLLEIHNRSLSLETMVAVASKNPSQTMNDNFLPAFCTRNDYPYCYSVKMLCGFMANYDSAIRIVRSLCSSFKELAIQETQKRRDDNSIHTAIDLESYYDERIISSNQICDLYLYIYNHILENNYRIMFYNCNSSMDFFKQRGEKSIEKIIQAGTPPLWNREFNHLPLRIFISVLLEFENQVLDTTNIGNDVKSYICLLSQQVMLRAMVGKFGVSVTRFPSDYCKVVLPSDLYSLMPPEVLNRLPTTEKYHLSEPLYASTINKQIEILIDERIAFPLSWFESSVSEMQWHKELNADQKAQLDKYWKDIFKMVGNNVSSDIVAHDDGMMVDDNNDENVVPEPSYATAMEPSEEAKFWISYARSKISEEHPDDTTTTTQGIAVGGMITANVETRYEDDAEMVDTDQLQLHVPDGKPDTQLDDAVVTTAANEESNFSFEQPSHPRQKEEVADDPAVALRDIDGENDAVLFHGGSASQFEDENEYNDSDEEEQDDDLDNDDEVEVEAEVYIEGEEDSDGEDQQHQQTFIGGNADEPIDIDDDEEEEDDETEFESDDNSHDGENQDENIHDDNQNRSDNQLMSSNQYSENRNRDEIDVNEMDVHERSDGEEEDQGDGDEGDSADAKLVCNPPKESAPRNPLGQDENIRDDESKQSQPTDEFVNDDAMEETTANDQLRAENEVKDDSNDIHCSLITTEAIVFSTHRESSNSPYEANSKKDNALSDAPTKSHLLLRPSDSEAGYEAEDSQDAGTEEEDNEYHGDSTILQEIVTERDPLQSNTSTASNIEESNLPFESLLQHSTKARKDDISEIRQEVSTFIDQGYEPDPESQSHVDIDGVPQVCHLEAGYDGEESQCHTEDDIHTEDEHQTEESELCSRSDARIHDSVNNVFPQQLIRPAPSADGMTADDEMEAESSEVEMIDGGSNSLQKPLLKLHIPVNQSLSLTSEVNLLTQIATSIQNEHSYASPEKSHSLNVRNQCDGIQDIPQVHMNSIPSIDGNDDDDEDESSDSVRSKPGDEISCPMSETHSSQSSVGMQSAAKSAASSEKSQPRTDAVPITEIQTSAVVDDSALDEATSVGKVTRSDENRRLAPLTAETSTPSDERTAIAAKETPAKLPPMMTRKREAASALDSSASKIVKSKAASTPDSSTRDSHGRKGGSTADKSATGRKLVSTPDSSVRAKKRKTALDVSVFEGTKSKITAVPVVSTKQGKGRPPKPPTIVGEKVHVTEKRATRSSARDIVPSRNERLVATDEPESPISTVSSQRRNLRSTTGISNDNTSSSPGILNLPTIERITRSKHVASTESVSPSISSSTKHAKKQPKESSSTISAVNSTGSQRVTRSHASKKK